MAWNPQQHGDAILGVVITIVMIGVAVAVGIMIQSQFESIPVYVNGTTSFIRIPSGFRLDTYAGLLSLLLMLLIISGVIFIVFKVIIPSLRTGTELGRWIEIPKRLVVMVVRVFVVAGRVVVEAVVVIVAAPVKILVPT